MADASRRRRRWWALPALVAGAGAGWVIYRRAGATPRPIHVGDGVVAGPTGAAAPKVRAARDTAPGAATSAATPEPSAAPEPATVPATAAPGSSSAIAAAADPVAVAADSNDADPPARSTVRRLAAVPDAEPTAGTGAAEPDEPYGAGSARPLPDGSAPGPEYTIKGNAASMLFHTQASPYYARTKAEAWFRTPEDATRAGFTEWKPKRRAR